MMKYSIDYSKSPCPNVDALHDIQEYLGDRYETVAEHMKTLQNARVFTFAASFAGVQGLPVRAWYDHFNGQGAYDVWYDENEPETK
jgi:hypothetical protein